MKITKFVHSCLLVEMPEPVNRTALFDPGSMSEGSLDVDKLEFLDDIIITHGHADHFSVDLIKKLVQKFPKVRITGTQEVVRALQQENITASSEASEGIVLFDAPHEEVEPLFPNPENIGVHYLDLFTNPGDSHTFTDSKAVLALPVQAPWGSTVKAVKLAMELKPKYIIPIHDWHWSDDARQGTYANLEQALGKEGITFCKIETGKPVVLEV